MQTTAPELTADHIALQAIESAQLFANPGRRWSTVTRYAVAEAGLIPYRPSRFTDTDPLTAALADEAQQIVQHIMGDVAGDVSGTERRYQHALARAKRAVNAHWARVALTRDCCN